MQREAVEMGLDFWRIEWPNAAFLFALALTPCIAFLDLGTRAEQHPAAEIVSNAGSTALAPVNEGDQDEVHSTRE